MSSNISYITEALLKIADNRSQQLFGNIVIFAGGTGSGKGFVLDNLLDISGKVFDVDKLKTLALRSPKIIERIKKETGEDISKLNLKNPDDTSLLHSLIKEIGLADRYQETAFASILLDDESRKPNLIFDMTLKDFDDLEEISMYAKRLGYLKSNIHIVWVVNDIDTAKAQNKHRERVVDEKRLEYIHMQVALTMSSIINYGTKISKYFDGKMYIVFNNKLQDDLYSIRNTVGNFYIQDAKYVLIKKQNDNIQSLDRETQDKIMKYTKNGYRLN